jgi:hypothetical protein
MPTKAELAADLARARRSHRRWKKEARRWMTLMRHWRHGYRVVLTDLEKRKLEVVELKKTLQGLRSWE